jgi:hypothetical protein
MEELPCKSLVNIAIYITLEAILGPSPIRLVEIPYQFHAMKHDKSKLEMSSQS